MLGEPNLDAPLEDSNGIGELCPQQRGDHVQPLFVDESDGELYARLGLELMRFATTLVGPSEAEDLLASAVTNAISSPSWARVQNRRAYLYRMLVNEAGRSWRTASRRRRRELLVVHRDAIEMERGVDPDVLAALKRLSVRQRAVIHFIYWADLTPHQVADMLDISLRTVERELANARIRLGEMLS